MRRLADVFANALARQRADREIRKLRERLEAEVVELRHRHREIVGNSEALRAVLSQAEQVAPTGSTVLILGETGTGKELVAQLIHSLSPRRGEPMVKINCAALPATLIEGELFGREKGAYTGAVTSEAGRFEAADGSTLFLDEIGELPPEVQAKLLRVLEDGELERLGSSRTRKVDVRLIAASNRDLERAVESGAFRRDLYYRLAVFPILVPPLRHRRGDVELPPLRARTEDIPALAQRFLEQVNERLARDKQRLSESALAALARHSWPGNVRELRNAVEQAAVLTTGREIGESDLHLTRSPTAVAADADEVPEGATFADAKRAAVQHFERSFLLRALRAHDGNISRTAEAIGMVRQSLQQKIRELGLRSEDWSRSENGSS